MVTNPHVQHSFSRVDSSETYKFLLSGILDFSSCQIVISHVIRRLCIGPVDVIDVDLSDHRLLRWPVPLVRPPPVYTTITTRPWRQLDIADLRAGMLESSLCRSDTWGDLDLDGLAQLYDVIINVLDRFIPFRTVKCRRRPSDPWFDEECRAAKCPTRRLELDGRHVQCRSRCCCHRRVENSTPSLPRPA